MIVHAGRKHYLYSASSSERWMACPGSIARAASMPPGTQSSYALDGEEAHETGEFALTHQVNSALEAYMLSGAAWYHRHDTQDERVNSVQVYIDHVQDEISVFDPQVFLEVQFKFPTPLTDDAGGTSDVALYSPDFNVVDIMDFKHGAGKAVEVENNSQLLFYAVGVRHALRQQGLALDGGTLYRLTIIQPRAFHKSGGIREWVCDNARLDAFVDEVNTAIRKTQAQVPEIRPGKWCRWCPAYMACPEAERDRIEKFFPDVKSVNDLAAHAVPDVVGLDVEKLARILEAAPMIKEFIAAAEQQALALARQGVSIPRHKLVYAQARRKWNDDNERNVATALANITGMPVDAFLKRSVVGITEAEDMVRQAMYKQVGGDKKAARPLVKDANEALATLTTKDTSGNLTLTTYDDKRPEVNVANMITYNPVAST